MEAGGLETKSTFILYFHFRKSIKPASSTFICCGGASSRRASSNSNTQLVLSSILPTDCVCKKTFINMYIKFLKHLFSVLSNYVLSFLIYISVCSVLIYSSQFLWYAGSIGSELANPIFFKTSWGASWLLVCFRIAYIRSWEQNLWIF